MIDIHSHLLPSLDDGPSEIGESLKIIKFLSYLGFSELIPTPHKFHSLFNPMPEEVLARVKSIKRSIIKRFSFEYNYRLESIKALKNHYEICRTLDGNKVILVEFTSPLIINSNGIENALFSLNASGFIPIFAHIERYLKSDEFWINLKKRHKVFFQASIRTFAKPSFHPKKKQILKFIEIGLIDNLATDIHRLSHIDKIGKGLHFFQTRFKSYEKDLFTDKFSFS